MSSQRLPGKVLADIAGRTMLERVVAAARASGVCDQIIVATSDDQSDDPIVAAARTIAVSVHRGQLDDVLGRFLGALKDFPDNTIVVRLTADCPLLDPSVIRMAVRAFEEAHVDYLSTIRSRSLPRGLDVEVIALASLRDADNKASGYQRSHVTPAIYENPGEFQIAGISFEPSSDDLRVTVDTPNDLEAVRQIILGMGDRANDRLALVSFLRSHPEVAAINSGVIHKDLKDG